MTFASLGSYLTTSGGPEMEPRFRREAKRGGEPNVLLLWLRNWPAAFAASRPAAAGYIRGLGW